MTSEENQILQSEIKNRIKDLNRNIDSLGKMSAPIAPDRALGRVGRADAIHIQSIQEANLRTCKDSLCKLEVVLKLIKENKYGSCSYCKKEIGFERLRAMPETNKCISCAEKYGF